MKVFYRPEMVAVNAESFSPSALKPKLAVEAWLRLGIVKDEDIVGFLPATREDFYSAHHAEMVNDVLDGKRENGFGNTNPDVAASLPYTTGSMLAAARHSVASQTVACSPTSGFHHAGFDYSNGFCTFNGLMVTALALKAAGLVETVGIIDCDVHYGDGTAHIINAIGAGWIKHHTMGEHFITRRAASQGRFQSWLNRAIEDCQGVDLVLYQAGADPEINDPLGGVLTASEMQQRDIAVRDGFSGTPLVWNLAGGYQRDSKGGITPVLQLHNTTANVFTGAI